MRISVFSTGYVGLVMVAGLANVVHDVICLPGTWAPPNA